MGHGVNGIRSTPTDLETIHGLRLEALRVNVRKKHFNGHDASVSISLEVLGHLNQAQLAIVPAFF